MSGLLKTAAELLYREASYLDEQRWDEWLALYDENAEFWVPAWKSEHELTTDPDRELSLMYYPSRAGLEDRVQRIRSGKSLASTPLMRSVHAVNNIRVGAPDGDTLEVSSTWTVHVYDTRRRETHVFFGRYEHRLAERGGASRILRKKIILANDCIPTMLDIYCI